MRKREVQALYLSAGYSDRGWIFGIEGGEPNFFTPSQTAPQSAQGVGVASSPRSLQLGGKPVQPEQIKKCLG